MQATTPSGSRTSWQVTPRDTLKNSQPSKHKIMQSFLTSCPCQDLPHPLLPLPSQRQAKQKTYSRMCPCASCGMEQAHSTVSKPFAISASASECVFPCSATIRPACAQFEHPCMEGIKRNQNVGVKCHAVDDSNKPVLPCGPSRGCGSDTEWRNAL